MCNTNENGFKYDLTSIEALIKSNYVLSGKSNVKTRNLWISKLDRISIEEHKNVDQYVSVLWCGSADDVRGFGNDSFLVMGFNINLKRREAVVSFITSRSKLSTCTEELDILAEGVFSEQWKYDLNRKGEEIIDLVQGEGGVGREGVLIPTEGDQPVMGFNLGHIIPKHRHIKIFNFFPYDRAASTYWELYEINKQWRDHHYAGFKPIDGVDVKLLISKSEGAEEYLFLMVEEMMKDDQLVIQARRRTLYMFRLTFEHDITYSQALLTMEDGEFDFAKFLKTCNGKIVIEDVLPGHFQKEKPEWMRVRKTYSSDLNVFEEVEMFKKINPIVGNPDHIRETYNSDLKEGEFPKSVKTGPQFTVLDFFRRHQDKNIDLSGDLVVGCSFNDVGEALLQLSGKLCQGGGRKFLFEDDIEEFYVTEVGETEVSASNESDHTHKGKLSCVLVAKSVTDQNGSKIDCKIMAQGDIDYKIWENKKPSN